MANPINGYIEDRASAFKPAGTASAGVSQYAAAADHVHPAVTPTPAEVGTVHLVDAPASASAAGKKGDVAFDSSYLYVCTADNTWVRAAIATWS